MRNTMLTTTETGYPLLVRVVLAGDAYGRDDCLTHSGDDALVEFYGHDPAAEDGRGWFIGRYNHSTLAASGKRHPASAAVTAGLALIGTDRKYDVAGSVMAEVMGWVKSIAGHPAPSLRVVDDLPF